MTTKPLKLVALVLLVLTVGLAGCMSDDETKRAGPRRPRRAWKPAWTAWPRRRRARPSTCASRSTGCSGSRALAMVATQKGLRASRTSRRSPGQSTERRRALRGDRLRVRRRGREEVPRRSRSGATTSGSSSPTPRPRQEGQGRADESRQEPEGLHRRVRDFLADATELPEAALKGITEHVTGSRPSSTRTRPRTTTGVRNERMAYDHMAMTGDTLAGGIVEQSPDKYANGTGPVGVRPPRDAREAARRARLLARSRRRRA